MKAQTLAFLCASWVSVAAGVHPEVCSSGEVCEDANSSTHLLQHKSQLESAATTLSSLPYCVRLAEAPSVRAARAEELARAPPAESHSCQHFGSQLRGHSPEQAQGAIQAISEVTERALAAKPSDEATAGTCLELLFEALVNFKDEPEVMRTAWRGLSQHTFVNPVGAALVANTGGPMKGVAFIVEQMRAHPEPHLAENAEHLTLKYEMLQTVHGILEHDSSNEYGPAFLREGLTEQILHAIRVEPSLRGTQEVACNCIEWLMESNPGAIPKFEEEGVVELLVHAVDSFRLTTDPTPFSMCNGNGVGYPFTLGDAFTVVPTCAKVLMKCAKASPAAAKEMEALGLLEKIRNVRPEIVTTVFALVLELEELQQKAL